MNKLFTKIVGAFLGLTMAVGVGVAVASSSKAGSVSAANPGSSIYTSGTPSFGSSYAGGVTKTMNSVDWYFSNVGNNTSMGWNKASQNNNNIGSGPLSNINEDTQIGAYQTSGAFTNAQKISVTVSNADSVSGNWYVWYSTNSGSSWTQGTTGELSSSTTSFTYDHGSKIGASVYFAFGYGCSVTTKTRVNLSGIEVWEEAAAVTQTITASATEAYSDESVTLSTNATSATWSITSGGSYAHLSSTSGESVSLIGDAAGSVTVKAVASGYTDATKTITFTERPTGTYYDVTFNSNGGSSSPAKQSILEGETFTFPSPGTKTHYSFLGWSSDGGTTKHAAGSTSPAVDADITYTAYWQEDAKVTVTYSAGTNATGSYSHTNQYVGSYSLLALNSLSGITYDSTTYRLKDYVVGGVSKQPGDSITLSAATTVTVNFEEIPLEYVMTFGSTKNTNPTEIKTNDAYHSTYSSVDSDVVASDFSKIYGVSASQLKCGSGSASATVTFTIGSDTYITSFVVVVETAGGTSLNVTSGAANAQTENQSISVGTLTFDDYFASEKSNSVTMASTATGAFYLSSITINYAYKTPELHASSTDVEAVISTSTASINLTYDNFTPTSYSEVITGSSVTSVAYNTSSTPHTATFTTSATTGESTVVITGTGGGKNASVTITVNVTNPRNVTGLTITTASDATTFKVGDTFDVGSLVITATFDAAPTTVVYSKANGNIGNLTSDPVIGYEFVEADIGTITTATFELEFGTGDEYCEYTIAVIDKDYAAPVTNLNSLWDGQKVYFSNGSDAAFPKYSAGNNVSSVSATIHETKGIDIESTSAYQYTVHRMKVDSTVYYLFSLEDSGTTYYIKDAGTSGSSGKNAISKVSDITDTAIYWTLEAGANSGQWIITNRSNEAKPNLQVNGTYLSCYNGGQTDPYLYAVTSYSESAVAADFAAGAMHMSEDISGQCVDYYPIAKQAWNAMSDDEKLYVDEEQPLAYARLVAWAAYHGETINGSYNIVSASRISILNTTLGKNSNTVAIIVIISMISVSCIGGYIFLRKRKEN